LVGGFQGECSGLDWAVALEIHVAAAPERPLVIYDGECGFCVFWVQRWQRVTGGRVGYLALQSPEVAARFPELPSMRLAAGVCVIEPGGRACFGAEAVFRALATDPRKRRLLEWYEYSAAFARVSEGLYGFVARRRRIFSWVVRLVWGR
jgi:predicted DCC family thiol-disulfide oxidoreductase YuxK